MAWWTRAVFLITGSNDNLNPQGTGFICCREKGAVFVVTCWHVIREFGRDNPHILGQSCKVVSEAGDDDLDLALLRVEGLDDMSVLALASRAEQDLSFETYGYEPIGRPLCGTLGTPLSRPHASHQDVPAWDYYLREGARKLEKIKDGYSGAPIYDPQSRSVVAVITHRQGSDKGFAIDISNLPRVYPSAIFWLKKATDEQAIRYPRRHRTPDSQFKQKIRGEIRRVLGFNKYLNDALHDEAAKSGYPVSADMAEFLCGSELETALDDLLYPATKASLVAHPQEFDDTWKAAKAVLSWMSLLAVSDEWIDEMEKRELLKSDLSFEIVVNTPCGVEIVSSRYRQISPNLCVDEGKPYVYGGQMIREPDGGASRNDDYALEQLLREVWVCVFPEDSRSNLSDGDLRTLNATLAQREKHKTRHYYIPVSADSQSRLNRCDFYEKLMASLPSITVIYIKSSGGTPSLRISDEWYFMSSIREFLTIIHERLDKRI